MENYFDTRNDSLTNDDAFTPLGDNHWTTKRYNDKRDKIYKVIAAMNWPDIIGMAEVENSAVLRDLCHYTPLRKFGYDYIHYDSPDGRGIDCALLFRTGTFKAFESTPICVSDSQSAFFTRDILMVGGILKDTNGSDTCYIFVNHWPSKRGGATASKHRLRIAHTLMALMDSVQRTHCGALVLAMGDFNASPEEEAIKHGLGFHGAARNAQGFHNLMYQIPKGEGSYKYHDNWSCIDQIIANRKLTVSIFRQDFLLTDDPKYLGTKPSRTYTGMRYLGGFSDHLPLIACIP